MSSKKNPFTTKYPTFRPKYTRDKYPYSDKQVVIVDEESLSDFSKLKEDLSKYSTEPFSIQYIDEEGDLVPINSEEELKEFAKFSKQHSSDNIMLLLNFQRKHRVTFNSDAEKMIWWESRAANGEQTSKPQRGASDELISKPQRAASGGQTSADATTDIIIKQWKHNLKSQLKKEILSELKDELGARAQPNADSNGAVENEEDSDGNWVYFPDKKKIKMALAIKKLEKKEKHAEYKFDHRLEKLEMKRKKLLEKTSLRGANKIASVDTDIDLPVILSGIASRDSVFLPKKVNVGKVFIHQWRIINDGTVCWNDVQLQHTWSTLGLEPNELVLKCNPLLPGQECTVVTRFRAPKSVGTFVSYWHLVEVDGTQQTQFGHYVSVTGTTKLPKCITVTLQTKEQDYNKMPNLEENSVKFNEEVNVGDVNIDSLAQQKSARCEKSLASTEIANEMAREALNALLRHTSLLQSGGDESSSFNIKSKGKKIVSFNDKVKLSTKNVSTEEGESSQNMKPLASTGIAAEMAREAANALLRHTSVLQAGVEELTEKCHDLQLADSGSDSDMYADVNVEETDRGFVLVDIPSSSSTEKSKPKENNIQTLTVDSAEEKKEINLLTNQVNNENMVVPPETNNDGDININTNKMLEKETVVSKDVNTNNQDSTGQKNNLSDEMNQQQTPQDSSKLYWGPTFPPQKPMKHPSQFTLPTLQHSTQATVFPPHPLSSHDFSFPSPLINYPSPPVAFPPPVYAPPVYPPPVFTPIITAEVTSPAPPVYVYPPPMTSSHPVTVPNDVPPRFCPPPSSLYPVNPEQNLNTAEQTPTNEEKVDVPPVTNNSNPPSQTVQITTNPLYPPLPAGCVRELAARERAVSDNQPRPATDSKNDPTVQILPQYLVDGAINVASTAYSTARNALTNFRLKEHEAQGFDPVFQNNMALLVEMGFRNMERNARLLRRYNNDVNQVIGVICSGGDNLEID